MTTEIKSIFDKYPDYEATIGIEVHVQLKTKSKLFCSCPNEFGSEPNKNICPICAGHPGTLPMLNRRAVDFAIMAGLATKCKITKHSTFARKHYMYPDLPKNFQITQDDKPICREGSISIIDEHEKEKNIRLFRIHMEEDAGKNMHTGSEESYVDLNRAGTPLLEIVSYPDIKNAFEAKAYLMQLRTIIQYLGISDANMEEGSFRADTNISVKKRNVTELGTRVELKNINSFRFISQAIDHEIERQIELILDGGTVVQETRLWDTKRHISVAMRSKENAQDYRYFTEPDLSPIIISDQWLEMIEKHIPELPQAKLARFQEEHDLSLYEATILTSELDLANFFEEAVKLCKNPKQMCNWMLRDLKAYLNEHKILINQSQVTPEIFAEFITVIDKGIINTKVAQDVFLEMMATGKYPSIIIQEKDLQQIDNDEELEAAITEIIKNNAQLVEKYRNGEERLFGFFVGQTMKTTKGKGNPARINELLKKYLS